MSSTPTSRSESVQESLSETYSRLKVREVPRGIHLRATFPSSFFNRVLQARLFNVIVLNVGDALQMLEAYQNPEHLIGTDCLLIITETEKDEVLLERSQKDVWRLLRQIQPVVFVPDAGMVYKEDSSDEQRNGVRAYRDRLEKVTARVRSESWTVRVLPLLKGIRQSHFEMLESTFEQFGFEEAAFYGAPYSGQDVGNAIGDLVKHVENAITVLDPREILILGQHGISNLRKLPPQVTAAAGLRQFARRFRHLPIVPSDVRAWRQSRSDALLANTNTPTIQTTLSGGVC